MRSLLLLVDGGINKKDMHHSPGGLLRPGTSASLLGSVNAALNAG
jgi:hypothetical protein